VACKAIKRAVGEVCYENIDGATVDKASHGMRDFDHYGIWPITLPPGGPQRLKFRKTISGTR